MGTNSKEMLGSIVVPHNIVKDLNSVMILATILLLCLFFGSHVVTRSSNFILLKS